MSIVAKRLDTSRNGMEVGLGPGHFVWGPSSLPQKGFRAPNFQTERQWSDSIARAILQTVAQKHPIDKTVV